MDAGDEPRPKVRVIGGSLTLPADFPLELLPRTSLGVPRLFGTLSEASELAGRPELALRQALARNEIDGRKDGAKLMLYLPSVIAWQAKLPAWRPTKPLDQRVPLRTGRRKVGKFAQQQAAEAQARSEAAAPPLGGSAEAPPPATSAATSAVTTAATTSATSATGTASSTSGAAGSAPARKATGAASAPASPLAPPKRGRGRPYGSKDKAPRRPYGSGRDARP